MNRGWVPRGWRDKTVKVDQNVDEASEPQEAVKKMDEKVHGGNFGPKKNLKLLLR